MPDRTRARPAWAHPDAHRILPTDAPRHEWLTARRQGIGGSDASTIAGVGYGSLFELWLDKTGRLPDEPETPAMRFGRLAEPLLRDAFTAETGIDVRRVGLLQSKARPWQQVSLDGLTSDGGILEMKTAGWRLAGDWADGQTADHAEVQIQHALAVTGRSHGWAIALIERDFHIRRVERDDALIDTLTAMERAFWEDCVLPDREPVLTAADLDVTRRLHPAVTDLDTAWADPDWLRGLLADRADAAANVKAAKDALAALDATLIHAIGDHEAIGARVDGQPLIYATRKTITSRRLDLDALRAAHPDIADQHTHSAESRRLHVPAKPRKA